MPSSSKPHGEQLMVDSRASAVSVDAVSEKASVSGRAAVMLGPSGTTLRELLQLVRNTVQTVKAVNSFRRLDKHTKESIGKLLQRADMREWCNVHGKHMSPPRLHPAIRQTVREWFELVDDDGSGTLEHEELMQALKAAHIPCDTSSITEMIELMDRSKRGCIAWHDFECFMMAEFASGKSLLSGEYMLPSGMALPFGAMIAQLRRNRIMKDVMEGGAERNKWQWAEGLAENQLAVANAEQAIKDEKAFALTSHLRNHEVTLQLTLGQLGQRINVTSSQDGISTQRCWSSSGSIHAGSEAQQRRQSNSMHSLTPEAQQVLARRSSAADGAVISPLVASMQRTNVAAPDGADAAGGNEQSSSPSASHVPRLNLNFQAPAGLAGPRVSVTPQAGSRLSMTARASQVPLEQRAAQLQGVAPFWSPATTPRMQDMLLQAQKQQQQQQTQGIAARLNMLRSTTPTAANTAGQQQLEAEAADTAATPSPSTPRADSRAMLERLPQALREPPHAGPASPRRQSAPTYAGCSPRSSAQQSPRRHAMSPGDAAAPGVSGAEAADAGSMDPNWQAKASSMLAREYRLHLMTPRAQSALNERPPSTAQPTAAAPRLRLVSESGASCIAEHGLCDAPKDDAETRQLLSALGSARVVPPALLLSGPLRAQSAAASQLRAPALACPNRASSPAAARASSQPRSSSATIIGAASLRCPLVATNHGPRPLSKADHAWHGSSNSETSGAHKPAKAAAGGMAASPRRSMPGKAGGPCSNASGSSAGLVKLGKAPRLAYAATVCISPR